MRVQSIVKSQSGAVAIEFAIIFVVMVAVTVGVIEASLAMFQWIGAEKATQLGARRAVVSNVVAADLAGFAGRATDAYPEGTPCHLEGQPLASSPCYFSVVSCSAGGCTEGPFDGATFAAIVAEMRRALPRIRPENVRVEYSFAGLGYVGQPGGLPLSVTVRLLDMSVEFIVIDALLGLGGRLPMPGFVSTLPGEDLSSAAAKA